MYTIPLMILFMLASLVSAFAGINDPTWNPPARFDHKYSGHLVTHYLPQKQVAIVCAKVTGQFSYKEHGCSTGDVSGICTIYVSNKTFMKATPKAIRRHEIGHCNGWSKNHEN